MEYILSRSQQASCSHWWYVRSSGGGMGFLPFQRCLPRKHLTNAVCFAAACLTLHLFASSSVFQAPLNVYSRAADGDNRCCVVVKNARYLMNSGGFQIGHWGFLLADIFAGLNGTRHFPKACKLILTDSVATRHRLNQVKKVAKRSTYLHTSLAVIRNMTGIVFEISDQIPKCRASAFIIADALKIPTQWLNLSAYRAPEDAARDVLKCNGTASEDILIYNRQGSRTIVNHEEVVEYIKKLGLIVNVLFPEHLAPEEQICEMAKDRKLIITPHGGQQGSLFFKRTGVAVAVVSPEAHLLEYYRFFARENDPWYHIRGNRSWSCVRKFCADSDGAWGNVGLCGIECERRARGHTISLSSSALQEVLKGLGFRV